MSTDITALTTNLGKLDECTDKNEKQEQDRKEKDEQLSGAIERKVTKEKHKRERPIGRDGTIKECKRLLKEGASPTVLTKLEKSLRGQEKYHRYYVQCFLPVLKRKISKKLDPIKREEIEKVISNIIGESVNHNHYSRRDSQDSGIGSDSDDRRQTDNMNVNDRLLEAAKRGNKTKIKRRVQEGAHINTKDSKGNNALHYVIALPQGQQRIACLNLILSLVKRGKIPKDELIEAINPEKGQTLIQKLLFNKITKGEHSSESVSGKVRKFLKMQFTKYDDNTIEAAIKLFELGANIGDLQLSKEELQNLDREHERYYLKFIEKLAESIKKPELKQEIKTQIKKIIAYTINTPDSNGNYLLHSTINNYDKELFKELLQKRVDVSLKDANGDNALHRIALLKKEHKITYLKSILDLKEEGTILSKTLREAINTKNNDNRYPAQVALVRQIEKIPSKLKDFSKWVRPRPTKHYYTAEFCAMLLQNGAENKSDHITIERYDNKKYYHTKERIQELTGVSPNREVDEALNQKFSKNRKRGNNIDLPVRWILGGLIFATVFSALAGNMVVAAALSVTIAVCAICYPAYLKLEKFLNDRNSKTQKSSDQPKHTESSPSPKVDNVLIQVLKDCQEFNKQINTPSSPGR
ncbi:hypothetical protein [Wolbachia endosymbiont of Tettigetta isshikii]|uniref:hypothetical protein n=1 Tax=Wolbachia endosymbiont of Tettigetta isshikii TaxID=3239093 RepID=UPI00397FC1DC